MKLEHLVRNPSGPTLDDVCFLGYRFDPEVGFQWDQVDSWVLHSKVENVQLIMSAGGWLRELWRATTGHVFVAGSEAVYRLSPEPGDPGWKFETDEFEATMTGIWGADHRFVFAWGLDGDRDVMFLWEGSSWREVAPPGRVFGVHGISRDLIYAVGRHGLIARWNGAGWDRLPSYTDTVLSRVFVASPDEMYATGAGGQLLEGSIHGWSVLVTRERALHDVARHGDTVWVAAGSDGLFKLEGKELVEFSTKCTPERFDARGELLVSARNRVLQHVSGRTFRSVGMEAFIDMTAKRPPLWLESE